jgi:hypothetical protein
VAGLSAMILEMASVEECYGTRTKRMVELKRLVALNKKLSSGCWTAVLRSQPSREETPENCKVEL